MAKHNADINEIVQKYRLRKWEVASEIGIADATFSRWLRRELTPERKAQIMKAIKKLAKEAEQ